MIARTHLSPSSLNVPASAPQKDAPEGTASNKNDSSPAEMTATADVTEKEKGDAHSPGDTNDKIASCEDKGAPKALDVGKSATPPVTKKTITPSPAVQAAIDRCFAVRNTPGSFIGWGERSEATAAAALALVVLMKNDHSALAAVRTVCNEERNADMAVRAMNAASTEHCGSAASAFIARLLAYRPDRIKAAIAKGMKRAESLGLTAGIGGARLGKTIAITYAAGRLARQFDILPASWGRLDRAFEAIFVPKSEAEATPVVSPARRAIAAYIESHRDEIRLVTDDDFPLPQKDFEQVAGVWVKPDEMLVASPRFIANHLADAPIILKQLRDEGVLDCDKGQLTKKAPRGIATKGRAHFIKVSCLA